MNTKPEIVIDQSAACDIMELMWAGYCNELTTFPCSDLNLANAECIEWLSSIMQGHTILSHYIDDNGMYRPCTRAA